MKKKEMKKKVLEYINREGSVSYAELEWFFEQNHYDYKGDVATASEKCIHVIFWSGWKREAFDMMGELIQEGKIHREPTSFLTYLLDGATQDLPMVKCNKQYKTDHWLPTVFCKGCDGSA